MSASSATVVPSEQIARQAVMASVLETVNRPGTMIVA